jgi:uncharacterized protein YbjQ (UPF0145 family)
MIITTSDNVPGREISATLGLVTENSVRARNVGRDVLAAFKNVVGGEIGAYRELLNESREEVLMRLTAQAEEMGADAIVALRLSTAAVMQGAAEILAYGTAVKLR